MIVTYDVIYILSSSGATVASYKYDPYGNIVSATGAMAGSNPLLYRGYYFDQDTGLYYLQNRYYDPKIARFINADSLVSTGQGVLGNNMFAYCNNNPANCSDATGMIAKTCLTADGRIEDSPWRNHSPGGGGFVYHCNDITTQYDGDKFYTQIIAREAWKVIKDGAKWVLDTYSKEYACQVEVQRREAEMINLVAPRIVKAGIATGFSLTVQQTVVTGLYQLSGSANQDEKVTATKIGLTFVAGFCLGAGHEIYCIFDEALNSP